MRAFRNLLLFAVMTATGIWAAERIVVHRVHLDSPMGTDSGHLIATGYNLIFVDDTDPDMSFTIPKADITTLHLNNGVITMNLNRPFTNMYGSRSDVVLNLDPAAAQLIANWAGLPLAGMTVERSRTATVPLAEQFNVKTIDLCDFFNPFRVVAMMSRWMMRIGNIDFRIDAIAAFAANHQSRYPS